MQWCGVERFFVLLSEKPCCSNYFKSVMCVDCGVNVLKKYVKLWIWIYEIFKDLWKCD